MNDLYLEQRDFLNQSANAPSQWDIQSFMPKYKNYILIIGESMRKDYMSLYGFPLKTTPFLERVKGTVLKIIILQHRIRNRLYNTPYIEQKRGNGLYG